MTIEKIYEELKNITIREDFIKLPKLLEDIEKTIREETCYKTSSKTRIKAIKNVASKEEHRPALKGYGILDDYKVITDSYHLVAIKEENMPLQLVATNEELEKLNINKEEYMEKNGINSIINCSYPNVSGLLNFDKNNCKTIEIDVDDVAKFYKVNKKFAKQNLYTIGQNLFNIKYIKNIIDVLGTNITVYEAGEYRPLYFINENDEMGLVVPCKKY